MIIEIIGPPGIGKSYYGSKILEFNNEIYSDTDIRNELSNIKKIIINGNSRVSDETIQMFSNDGYNLVNIGGFGQNNVQRSIMNGTSNQQNSNQRNSLGYKVRSDSTIKVPVIGRIKVVGLTLTRLERKIEELLKSEVHSPFVIARIYNRRIYIFQVVTLRVFFSFKTRTQLSLRY